MQPHATPEQLIEYLGRPVDNPDRLLRRASEHVDYHTHAPYDVDTDTGLAQDEEVAVALRDATCAQIEQWLETGEANAIDGLAKTPLSAKDYSGFRAPPLAPRAHYFLSLAGLVKVEAR